MRRVLLHTLGCKLNQSETMQLAEYLSARGDEIIEEADGNECVDVVYVNTCAVTGRAAAKSRHFISAIARRFPKAEINVLGCLGALERDNLYRLTNVKSVGVAGGLKRWKGVPGDVKSDLPAHPVNEPCEHQIRKDFQRVRPLVKIQDGCNQGCSFCIIPYLRGREMQSVPVSELVREVCKVAEAGLDEVVLTGVRIGSWGQDNKPRSSLINLIDALSTCGIKRVRLGSIEPWELSERLLERVIDGKFIAPHLHLSLQHTVSDILKKMNRPDTGNLFKRLKAARKADPNFGLGMDIIVGFPGETDAMFEKLVADVKGLPITYLHVFGFSPRPGTDAATLTGQINQKRIKERVAILRRIGELKRTEFYQTQIGRVVSAIPERSNNTRTTAVSDNYLKLQVLASGVEPGKIYNYMIKIDKSGMFGVLV